jgi:O-antigen/teichoic acid export membrane protein
VSTARRIFWNTAVLLGADVARLVIGLLLTPIIARVLGSAQLGQFTYVMSVVGILGVISDFGLSAFYVRQAQHETSPALAGTVLGTRIVIGGLVASGLAVYAVHYADRSLVELLLLGSLLLALGIFPGFVTAALRARELMIYEAILKVVSVVISTAGGIAAVISGWRVVGVLWVMVGINIATLLASIWLAVRYAPRPVLRQRLPAYWDTLRGAWPFASLAILVVVYFRIDSIMLFAMKGQAALGQYGAAYRLLEAGLLLPLTLAGAALPAVARLLSERTAEVLRASGRAIQFLAVISIPAAVFGAIFAPQFVTALYGPTFAEAAGVFQILVFTLIAVFASSVTSSLITASPRPEVNTYIAGVMVLWNVGLNLFLIPRWSGSGAAIATVVTETLGLLLGTFYIRRRIAPLAYGSALIKPTLATAAVALVAMRYPLLAALPVYGAAYVALLWAVHGVTRDDLDFLRALLRRPRTALLTGSGR